jgi:hypothetical protein
MKHNSLIWIGLWLLAVCPTLAQTNPIAKFYNGSEGYPAWTDRINWSNQINMGDFSNGSDDFEKFENARDQLYQQGGGVLYYPAGTYTFNCPSGPNGRGLMLKKGVVILGEEPETSKNAVTDLTPSNIDQHGLNDLKTKFIFTDTTLSGGKVPKMWNQIGIMPGEFEEGLKDVELVGLAWVEIEKGYIWMGYDLKKGWADTWGSSSSWLGKKAVNGWTQRKPDGRHPMDGFAGTQNMENDSAQMGGKRFVFGTKMVNCMVPNYVIDKAQKSQIDFYHENSGWRFGPRMAIYGNNIFIANNVLAKPNASFIHQDAYHPDKTVLFDYGYALGIDVNKSLWSFVNNVCDIDDPNAMYFQENIIIRDNWVYNHGHKGFEFTGKWAVIKNNINARDFHGKTVPYPELNGETIDGYVNHSNAKFHNSESADDNMSRAYDFGGWGLWLDNNRWGATGSSYANDGEGMLVQRHNGIEVFSFAYTNNIKQPDVRGDAGYIAPYDVHVIGMLQMHNIQPGGTGVAKVENNFLQDISVLKNYKTLSKDEQPGVGGGQGLNTCYLLSTCPSSQPDAPVIDLEHNKIEGYVDIKYQDISSSEIGFRIDRKSPGESSWTTIAYRPRQECQAEFTYPKPNSNYPKNTDHCFNKNADFNPPMWRDYTITVSDNYSYRVIALNCDEDTAYSSKEDVIIAGVSSEIKRVIDAQIFPNPSSDRIQIELTEASNQPVETQIFDMKGRLVQSKNFANSKTMTLNVKGMESGQYIIRIRTDNGSITDQLIIK